MLKGRVILIGEGVRNQATVSPEVLSFKMTPDLQEKAPETVTARL